MKNLALLLGTIERHPVREEPVARRAFSWGLLSGVLPLVTVLVPLPFMLRAVGRVADRRLVLVLALAGRHLSGSHRHAALEHLY